MESFRVLEEALRKLKVVDEVYSEDELARVGLSPYIPAADLERGEALLGFLVLIFFPSYFISNYLLPYLLLLLFVKDLITHVFL